MKLEQSFEVAAPLEQVWRALIDVERVAPCLPGAAVTGRNEDGSYNGTFTIKIGPTTASYTGRLEMQNVDEAAHSATMHAQGSDRRGQGGATATISSRLTPAGGGTRVEVVTDYHITGRLARFGRGGMIEDISERLLREFAGRLQASLAGGDRGAEAASARPEAAPPGAEAASAKASPGEPATEAPLAPPAEGVATPPPEAAPAPPPDTPPAPPDEGPASPAETASAPPAEAAPAPPAQAAPAPPAEAASAPSAEAAPTPPAQAAPAPPPTEGPPPPPPKGTPSPPPTEAPSPPPTGGPPPPPTGAPSPPPPPPPPTEEAAPIQGLSLVGGVLLDRIKRNPAPVIGVIGGLVVLRLLLRRR